MNMKLEMNKTETFLFLIGTGLLITGLVMSYITPEYYSNTFVTEDGLIEWLTFANLCALSLLCFWRFFSLLPHKKPVLLSTLGCALVFLFGAGEEISWGQRIFDIQSSQFFLDYNAQGETNLHNLKFYGIKLNKLIFGKILAVIVFLYFALCYLHGKNDRVRNFMDYWGVPVPKLAHIYFLGVILATILIMTHKREGEILEFSSTLLFFIIFAFPSNSYIFEKKRKES